MITIAILYTIQVNELPKHSHTIPGYWYSDINQNYWFLLANARGYLTVAYRDGTHNDIQYIVNDKQGDGIKRYRQFSIGESGGMPTSESGNNESLLITQNLSTKCYITKKDSYN